MPVTVIRIKAAAKIWPPLNNQSRESEDRHHPGTIRRAQGQRVQRTARNLYQLRVAPPFGGNPAREAGSGPHPPVRSLAMKLKRNPEDFIVTEINSREPTTGSFALYRLSKRSIGTLEALQIAQRSWNVAPKSVDHAGLKDRHADTQQLITIRNGPKARFEQELFLLEYLGQTPTPIEAADIVGNEFEIVLRSLPIDAATEIESRAAKVGTLGYPNYFDQQRFGSLGPSLEFVAAKWCQKDYERATWLALAEYNSHDDAEEREQKQLLRDNWGEWIECKQLLNRSHRRSVVTYLCDHPDKFRKAFALINEDLRGIYLSAFQSAVWNRMLGITLDDAAPDGPVAERIAIGDASLPFGSSPNVTAEMQLQLPSARCKGLDEKTRALCDAALQPYGMTLPDMKISFPRDRWFSRAQRNCLIRPDNLTAATSDDEDYPGRQKVSLSFSLPRGCYATMLVKSLTGDTEGDRDKNED
jgi:tRNA pseudouridine13 synthase